MKKKQLNVRVDIVTMELLENLLEVLDGETQAKIVSDSIFDFAVKHLGAENVKNIVFETYKVQ